MAGSPRLNRAVGFSYHNIVGKCKIGLYPIAVLCVIGALSVIVFSKCGGEWLPLLSSERVVVSSGIMMASSGPSSSSHELAMEELNGFFDDIPEEEWERLRKIAHNIQPNTKGDPSDTICFSRCMMPDMPSSIKNQIYSINSGIYVSNTALCCCRPSSGPRSDKNAGGFCNS